MKGESFLAMVEPEPEPLNVWEEATSPSSPLSSVSSFQQMREQRHRKLQASQEHRREGRRLQAECHELRRRVEELALLESLLLKHISKEIYGTLKPKSRNLSKENSPVSEIAVEKSPEGFIHHSEVQCHSVCTLLGICIFYPVLSAIFCCFFLICLLFCLWFVPFMFFPSLVLGVLACIMAEPSHCFWTY